MRFSSCTPSASSVFRSAIGAVFPSTYKCVTVILFCVKVPVLSEQMTVALPSASTEGSVRMMALRFTMRCTLMASTMVEMAGNPSGIAATAKETAVKNISSMPLPYSRPTPKMTIQMPMAAMASTLPSFASFICNGVGLVFSLISISAIRPTSVFIPVSTTIPEPRP